MSPKCKLASLLLLITTGSAPFALAEAPDVSGTFDCQCASVHCTTSEQFRITYDRDRQWLQAEGPSWIYSGYVSRQESKTTGAVYLVLPRGYSVMAAEQVLAILGDGTVQLNGSQLTCRRS